MIFVRKEFSKSLNSDLNVGFIKKTNCQSIHVCAMSHWTHSGILFKEPAIMYIVFVQTI